MYSAKLWVTSLLTTSFTWALSNDVNATTELEAASSSSTASQTTANDSEKGLSSLEQELKALRDRIDKLEKERQLSKQESKRKSAKGDEDPSADSGVMAQLSQLKEQTKENQNWPIKVHGAVRFQYVYEDYNPANESRGGDIDFDIFRLNFDGEIGDVILSAEYRWFQYQEAVKRAYFGYNLDDNWQAQVGIIKIPFGNMPYNSHSYFFNSTFYIGLEDEHDSGVKMRYRSDQWDFDIAFLKSDEQGGVDGYVSDRTARYNYDTVGIRLPGEGIYDTPELAVGESNSWALRGARQWTISDQENFEFGMSAQGGNLYSGNIDDSSSVSQWANQNVGHRSAFAIHGVYNNGPWNVQVQFGDYTYDLKIDNQGVVMAAYAFYDTIPSEASVYTGNVSYSLPVSFGPVTNLTFYNDHSLITDKQELENDTWMNVLGMAMAAGGGFYTYFDFVRAKNQPFIGGSIASDSGKVNNRFNINFGYYF